MRTIGISFITAMLLGGCGGAASPDDASQAAFDVESDAIARGTQSGGLSRAEAATVLDAVDDICGDTWCEGDHDFRFRRIVCHPREATCTLLFLMFPHGEAPTLASWRSCKTTGYTGLPSLVEMDSSGVAALTPAYYDALTACIGRLEATTSP